MTEYRSVLERLGRRAAPSDDAFERLVMRRGRRQRSRRVGVTALAFVIAAGGIAVALSALGGTSVSRPTAGRPRPYLAIWPQRTLREARAAQRMATEGNPSVAWQLNPREVAKRFAATMLGWTQVFSEPARPTDVRPAENRIRSVEVRTCREFDACMRGLGGRRQNFHAEVTVEQRIAAGPRGIWVVTAVNDVEFAMNAQPGTEVPSGAPIVAFVRLPKGSTVAAGSVYLGSCGSSTHVESVVVRGRQVRFRAATKGFGEECGAERSRGGGLLPTSRAGGGLDRPTAGYVFVFVPSPKGLQATPFEVRSARERTAVQMTAVPVRFTPKAEVATPITPDLVFPDPPAGGPNRKGSYKLNVRTSLPDGTKVFYGISDSFSETEGCCVDVDRGRLVLAIANNACTEKDGKLVSPTIKVTLTIAPVMWTGAFCPFGAGPGCGLTAQPPAVLAILGEHFEYLTGDQVQSGNGDNWVIVAHHYRFPASTCTAKIVDDRRISLTP